MTLKIPAYNNNLTSNLNKKLNVNESYSYYLKKDTRKTKRRRKVNISIFLCVNIMKQARSNKLSLFSILYITQLVRSEGRTFQILQKQNRQQTQLQVL